jgi:TupA-like ATPgrasp
MSQGRGPKAPRFPLSLIHPLGPMFRHLPLALRRHLLYVRHHRRWGNFKNPERYTEKIHWRVLNDHREMIALACDKLASKAYIRVVAQNDPRLRTLRIPAVLWTSDRPESLVNFLSRTDTSVVVKPNHSSGRSAFISKRDRNDALEEIDALVSLWLRRDEETEVLGHWGYGEARIGVIVEERVGGEGSRLVEIRCAAFAGKPDSYVVTKDVYTRMQTSEAYDADFTRMRIGFPTEVPIDRPGALASLSAARKEELRDIVSAIAAPYDHVRVDIYDDGAQFWFGELTVYPSGGALSYTEEVERARGKLWQLPSVNEVAASHHSQNLPAEVWLRERNQTLHASAAALATIND